jgi:hypothetical protein
MPDYSASKLDYNAPDDTNLVLDKAFVSTQHVKKNSPQRLDM